MLPFLWALLFWLNAGYWTYVLLKSKNTHRLGVISFAIVNSLVVAGLTQITIGQLATTWNPLWALGILLATLVFSPFLFFLLRQVFNTVALENELYSLQEEYQDAKNRLEHVALTDYIVDISVLYYGDLVSFMNQTYQEGRLIFPYFTVKELQKMLGSNDELTKAQGNFALKMVERLTKETIIHVETVKEEKEDEENYLDYQQKLLKFLDKHQGLLLVSNPETLQAVQAKNKRTIYLPAVASHLSPNYFVGQIVQCKIVEHGKEPGQGVAYLSDGSSLIIDGGESMISRNVSVKLQKVFQTVSGKTLYGSVEM